MSAFVQVQTGGHLLCFPCLFQDPLMSKEAEQHDLLHTGASRRDEQRMTRLRGDAQPVDLPHQRDDTSGAAASRASQVGLPRQ